MAHLSLPWPPQPPSSRAVACAVHPPSWHLLLHSPLHNGTFLGSHCPIPLWGSLTESQEYNESVVFVVIQGYSLSLINYVIDQMMSILVLKLSSVQLLIKMIYIYEFCYSMNYINSIFMTVICPKAELPGHWTLTSGFVGHHRPRHVVVLIFPSPVRTSSDPGTNGRHLLGFRAAV